jgi:hypothetical protein
MREYDLPGEIIFLVNGKERFALGNLVKVGRERMPSFNVLMEQMGIRLPYSTFMKIAFAQKVELRVDKFEFTLTDDDLRQLKKFDAQLSRS